MSHDIKAPVSPIRGVQFTPPPPALKSTLTMQAIAAAQASVGTLAPGENGRIVLVGTKNPGEEVAFNAAVVAKIDDHWQVTAWMGKTWGRDAHGGAMVTGSW